MSDSIVNPAQVRATSDITTADRQRQRIIDAVQRLAGAKLRDHPIWRYARTEIVVPGGAREVAVLEGEHAHRGTEAEALVRELRWVPLGLPDRDLDAYPAVQRVAAMCREALS